MDNNKLYLLLAATLLTGILIGHLFSELKPINVKSGADYVEKTMSNGGPYPALIKNDTTVSEGMNYYYAYGDISRAMLEHYIIEVCGQ